MGTEAEGERSGPAAVEIEAVGIVEDTRVAISAGKEEVDGDAAGQRESRLGLEILRGGTQAAEGRRLEAKHLLDRIGDPGRVGTEPREDCFLSQERADADREQAARGVVPREEQVDGHRLALLRREAVAILGRAGERGQQVVGGRAAAGFEEIAQEQ